MEPKRQWGMKSAGRRNAHRRDADQEAEIMVDIRWDHEQHWEKLSKEFAGEVNVVEKLF